MDLSSLLVFDDVFTKIAVLLLAAALIGALGMRLRQPLIVTFIIVGILAGPAGFGLVAANDHVDLLAKLGIALLLFVVGLKLDVNIIRTVGLAASTTGLGQVIFTSGIGYLIAIGLGLEPVAAIYVAVALTFSSTIIIVKLLSDKRQIDALHGRIAIGFLIVQDIVVVMVMIGLTAFGDVTNTDGLGGEAMITLLKGVGFLAIIGLLMRFAMNPLLRHLARSQELLILFAIAWAVFLATVGMAIGFNKEVGAFLAGISLASTPYREVIGARLVGLRDFLLLFFFIDLGAKLDMGLLGAQIGDSLVFSLFVLIGNPIIVMLIMGLLGYRKRTGFLAGLTVAQISEFSLILGALGVSLGHIGAETMGTITLVGLITISISTYLIVYSQPLYEWLAPVLGIFERRGKNREELHDADTKELEVDVILFGRGRYGSGIARGLHEAGLMVLCVDFDPDVVRTCDVARTCKTDDSPTRYGDAENPEFLATLPLEQVHWVISSIPALTLNLTLLHSLRHLNYSGNVAVTTHYAQEVEKLEKAGADVVLLPFADAAKEAAEKLAAAHDRPD